MKGPMTADEADDYVSEHGTGSPKTVGALQALILAEMAEEVDRRRQPYLAGRVTAATEAEREEAAEIAAILTQRRDALYAGASALRGVAWPDRERPLTAADYLIRTRAP